MKKLKGCLIILGVIIIVGAIVGAINSFISNEYPNSAYGKYLASLDATPTPEPSPTPTPPPTVQQQLQDIMQHADLTYGTRKATNYDAKANSVVVIYYIPHDEVWDKANEVSQIKINCFATLKALWQSHLTGDFTDTKVVVQGDLEDAYGNTSVGNVGTCELFKDTARKFNWDNMDQDSAWEVYDLTWLLPDLTNNSN